MSNQKARDISAPTQELILGDERYTLKYNNRQARITEDIYEREFGRDMNYMEILQDLIGMKHRAVMAVAYGGLIAGGAEMSWEEFDELFTYDALPGFKEKMLEMVTKSLPEPEEDAAKN